MPRLGGTYAPVSPRSLPHLFFFTVSIQGCLLPDDYDPCRGDCPDTALSFDVGPRVEPDGGVLLAAALGAVRVAADPPPALSGGTLLALRAAPRAVVADPDTDTIHVIDTSLPAELGALSLAAHDEPGRMVEDGAGRVHVVLRRAGAIATLDLGDPSAPVVAARRDVCPAPRGIAYDAPADALRVVCAGGEIVTLPPTGAATGSVRVAAGDLRDVVVEGAALRISRFRSAEVLRVEPGTGAVLGSLAIPRVTLSGHPLEPRVAWRSLATPRGDLLVLHQIERADVVAPMRASLDTSACTSAAVQARVTRIRGDLVGASATLPCAVLAVDVAVAPDGSELTVAAAGSAPLDPCHPLVTVPLRSDGTFGAVRSRECIALAGRVVSVAYAADGTLLAQTRAPLAIVTLTTAGVLRELQLPGRVIADTGFDAFHAGASARVACASCHPEGGDDGHVWLFDDADPRRTLSLRGGLLAGAPFEWHGEQPTFEAVFSDFFATRMQGGVPAPDVVDAEARWLDARPALPAAHAEDPAAVARGQALFESAALGCSTCHAGPRRSSAASVDAGTGGSYQVPSLLGVAYRAPYLHDACAATLHDVLGACARGGAHAVSSTSDADDLAAYLASL